MKKTLSLILFFIYFNTLAIQTKFSNLTILNGLPNSIIRDIVQDNEGLMWIATASGLASFDGYTITNIYDKNNNSLGDIWDLTTNHENLIYIASKTKGLFKYYQGNITKFNIFEKPHQITKIHLDTNNKLWIGTDKGIYKLINYKPKRIINLTENRPTDFLSYENNRIFALTEKDIYDINTTTHEFERIKINSSKINIKNYRLHKDFNGTIWLGREDGLFKYNEDCHCFLSFSSIDISVYSFTSDNNFLWIGTLYKGLYRYNYKTGKIDIISHNPNETYGISDNSIFSLYIDKSNVLWIGTFYSGINYTSLNSFNFQTFPTINSSKSCTNYNFIHDILVTKNNGTWLATETGLVKITNTKCLKLTHQNKNINSLSSNEISTLYQSENSTIWVGNMEGGLDKVNPTSLEVTRIGRQFNDISFYFITKYKKGYLLLGSFNKGLFTYDITKNKLKKLKIPNSKLGNLSVFNFAKDSSENYFFSTSHGLGYLKNEKFEMIDLPDKIKIDSVSTVTIDQEDNLWLVTNNHHFLKVHSNGLIEDHMEYLLEVNPLQINQKIQISNIINVSKNIMWLTTNQGLIKYNIKTHNRWLFTTKNGVLEGGFLYNSYWFDKTDILYIGGKKGVVEFSPSKIVISDYNPKIRLTQFRYFNKNIDSTTNKILNTTKPINYLKEIELSYKDYIIGFEFAALDYADSSRNKYAYRLIGFNDDWVFTDAKNRQATYTNLSPGEYVFQVKGSNKDGVWSKTPKELKIIVHPAPWFSPWAYTLYAFVFLFSIWFYIRFKTIASRKRAIFLEQKVEERTQEVNQQKKMVESLLEHKNEIFANITHEFKTPLALILGPAEQLANHRELIQHSNELNMIERNAKRLMLMVGQILKLSQAESDKEVIRESQAVQPLLLMLFEAFKPLAQKKNIDLQLLNTNDVNVYTTTECLEVVVSNLLSNALKYTNEGGKVILKSEQVNNQVSISVSDSGSGIREQDKSKIFKRFTRLDTHKNIAGTGIGLSVVKEITEANDGYVTIDSHWGEGSTFTVTFPITDIKASEEMSEVMVDQLVNNTENELDYTQQLPNTKKLKNRVTVLIIEDNLDMQSHIGKVLNHRYNCLFADRGRKGIGLALKELPDIVICDVMMPGMDGYQVTRILRHDGRTSHIPIILLTALNTTESRIKGWQENIDTYMTKPFNADELNAQIGNILTIRKLLQKQTNQAIRNNSALDSLDLSKQDEKFIDKFKDVIGKHYSNEYFQKADLASKMAISERQLQRKLKALIDQNPMEMLRDYRLEKAAMKLKDGYQVGIVSDECGFSSVSYFGSCFKKKYGITPKVYQTLNKS